MDTRGQVLVKEWRAPLRCRPYSKLEALNNQPEVHGGNEEYWHQKRRSVVPPKVLAVALLFTDYQSCRLIPVNGVLCADTCADIFWEERGKTARSKVTICTQAALRALACISYAYL